LILGLKIQKLKEKDRTRNQWIPSPIFLGIFKELSPRIYL
jgi:hypothetical protein